MYRRLSLRVGLLCLLMLPGCGDGSTEPTHPTITGTWTGSSPGVTFTTTLIEQRDRNVSGSGTVSAEGVPIPVQFQVQGRHEHPAVNLNLTTSVVVGTGTFVGTVDANATSMTGTLNGPGLTNVQLTLQRAP